MVSKHEAVMNQSNSLFTVQFRWFLAPRAFPPIAAVDLGQPLKSASRRACELAIPASRTRIPHRERPVVQAIKAGPIGYQSSVAGLGPKLGLNFGTHRVSTGFYATRGHEKGRLCP